MGSDDEVVTMDGKVGHGGVRQVQLERLPIIAVIEGDIYRAFSSGKEQAFVPRIFAHDIAGSARWNTIADFYPGFAEIARAIDVGTQIVETERVDCRIRGAGVEVGGLNDRDFAPWLQLRRRD